MNTKIAVVMPVYIKNDETLALTEAAIDSLGDTYLVIIDNASDRGTGYLQNISDCYIRNETNLGFAKAVNQGLKHIDENTDIKLVGIFNNDIRVSPNYQEVAKEVLQDPKVYSCHFTMLPYTELFDYEDFTATSGYERWCQGSCFVIDRSKDKIYYDEEFLNSYDDWDFFYRIRDKGFQTAFTKKACFLHKDSHTQQQIPAREENNQKNAEVYKQKHGMYAEDQFVKMYPDQYKKDYLDTFKIKR